MNANKMKNRAVVLLALVLAMSTFLMAFASPTFTDVPAGKWYSAAVYDMVDRGVVNGIGNNKFDPEGQVSIAQYYTMLTRLFYADEVAAEPGGRWFMAPMEVARKNDLIAGTSAADAYRNGTWNESLLSATTNRYMVAQATYNYMAVAGIVPSSAQLTAAQSKIPDYKNIPSTYRTAVCAVNAAGYLTGVDSTGKFNGSQSMTRAQAVTVLYRLITSIENGTAGQGTGSETTTPDTKPSTEPDTKPDTDTGSSSKLKDGYLTNGKPITVANIQEMLAELQEEFPDGMRWDESKEFYYTSPTVKACGYSAMGGCNAFAWRLTDRIFGDDANINKIEKHQRFNELKPGDILWTQNSNNGYNHVVVITDVYGDYFDACSGNSGDKVSWDNHGTPSNFYGSEYSKTYIYSRYTASAEEMDEMHNVEEEEEHDIRCGVCGYLMQKAGSNDFDFNGGSSFKICDICGDFFACYQCRNSQAYKDHVAHCDGTSNSGNNTGSSTGTGTGTNTGTNTGSNAGSNTGTGTGNSSGDSSSDSEDIRCAVCGFLMLEAGSNEMHYNGGYSFYICDKCNDYFVCYQCRNSQAYKNHVATCRG